MLSHFSNSNSSLCIECVLALKSVPFVFIYSLVIFGVDDGIFALCEWNPAEGVAVADAPIQKCKPNERL